MLQGSGSVAGVLTAMRKSSRVSFLGLGGALLGFGFLPWPAALAAALRLRLLEVSVEQPLLEEGSSLLPAV
jgi:hypothetical protein